MDASDTCLLCSCFWRHRGRHPEITWICSSNAMRPRRGAAVARLSDAIFTQSELSHNQVRVTECTMCPITHPSINQFIIIKYLLTWIIRFQSQIIYSATFFNHLPKTRTLTLAAHVTVACFLSIVMITEHKITTHRTQLKFTTHVKIKRIKNTNPRTRTVSRANNI